MMLVIVVCYCLDVCGLGYWFMVINLVRGLVEDVFVV